MKVKVVVEGRGFPLKIIIGYLLSSFSVGSIGKRGSLTIVLLLRRAVRRSEKFGGDTVVGKICLFPVEIGLTYLPKCGEPNAPTRKV